MNSSNIKIAALLCLSVPDMTIASFSSSGQKMYDIDLAATPRAVKMERPIPFPKIDAGFCDADGVKVFIGPEYYSYQSPMNLAMGKIKPAPQKISPKKFGCEE